MPHLPLRRRALFNLAGLALAPWPVCPAWAARPAQPLTLAMDAPPDIDPAGWLVSEKFDGVRAHWDGQHLRFRSGRPIAAPPAFTERLPPGQALDGELWLGRGRFDALSGAVRKARPVQAEWNALRYLVFDLPGAPGPFEQRARQLHRLVAALAWPACEAVPQRRCANRTELRAALQQVLRMGGEGLMLHRADALHAPGRQAHLLKLKPEQDAEAQVVAHLAGRGKHEGRVGALQVRTAQGQQFALGSGLSDSERLSPPALGEWVTYTHRGHTPQGLPRFATYLRRRAAE